MRSPSGRVLVYGFGVTGRAVAEALTKRGVAVVVADDSPTEALSAWSEAAGVDLAPRPDDHQLAGLLAGAPLVVPAPGLPERHRLFAAAAAAGTPVHSELDLAARWDARPCLAVTGTNGKTTAVTLITEMLRASGLAAVAAGNTDVPLVTAIDDPEPAVFVVEASSFRLATASEFRPIAGAWLNFAPDHLDVHASLASYEAAKARIWRGFAEDPTALAVANSEDEVVQRHASAQPTVETFGQGPKLGKARAHWGCGRDGVLTTPEGHTLAAPAELWSQRAFDLSNAQAAAATARAGGATLEGTRAALLGFRGLPHRVELVGEAGGVRFYDDSKSTTPHSTMAAVQFSSGPVVLIAGGRNKGVDLGLIATDERVRRGLRAVIAIGEAASELEAVFRAAGVAVTVAGSMSEAVTEAVTVAQPGDSVLLSPACASFDWYANYAERGEDFARHVRSLVGVR